MLGRAQAQSQSGSAGGAPSSGGSGSSAAPAQGYDACVQAAGSDLTKAQSCADLLN